MPARGSTHPGSSASALRQGEFPEREAPGILVMGISIRFIQSARWEKKLPWRMDGGRCYGPGILDMKGGNYIALEALRQLAKAGIATGCRDHSVHQRRGSRQPEHARAIEEEARRHAFVLVRNRASMDGIRGRRAAILRALSIGRPGVDAEPNGWRSAARDVVLEARVPGPARRRAAALPPRSARRVLGCRLPRRW